MKALGLLWFDVENKRYTTNQRIPNEIHQLWFDVENKRYTTIPLPSSSIF